MIPVEACWNVSTIVMFGLQSLVNPTREVTGAMQSNANLICIIVSAIVNRAILFG